MEMDANAKAARMIAKRTRRIARSAPKLASVTIAAPTFTSVTDVIKLPFTVIENGKPAKKMMRMFTAKVTVAHGNVSCTFSASSSGTWVKDSRDGKQKSFADVTAEIVRMFGNDELLNDLRLVALSEPKTARQKTLFSERGTPHFQRGTAPAVRVTQSPVVRISTPKVADTTKSIVGIRAGSLRHLNRQLLQRNARNVTLAITAVERLF